MMDWIGPNIVTYGPWLVGLMAMMETALIIGLVLPTEPTLILATTLAIQGHLTLTSVVVAAVLGALIGDSVGFSVGRWGLSSWSGSGRLSQLAAQQKERVEQLFERHSGFSICVARVIPFAPSVTRTAQPSICSFSSLASFDEGVL